jgi:hypothetical protein
MPAKKSALPATAKKRLKPYVDRGISNGIFADAKPVQEMFWRKARDPALATTIDELGGIDAEPAQQFVTETVLVDLSAILRQKRYTAHLEIWEVAHRTVGMASGNPRPACFIMGQAVVEDDDVESEPSLFRLSLWDGDASIADDIERDGTYAMAVSCKNLDAEILDLRPMQGLSAFSSEEYEHGSREELLRSMYDVTPIAELEDNLSSSLNDYRLIEATVSYSGLQNARSGSQFGKMLLKDDSTMTMDAIESGENLLLNCITSTGIASRFGKYSRVLALVTAKVNDYGLSANLECAVGLVVVKPPEAETSSTGGDDDSEDDAASYFKTDSNVPTIGADEDEEDEDDAPVDSAEAEDGGADSADDATKGDETATSSDSSSDSDSNDDDDWDDWD